MMWCATPRSESEAAVLCILLNPPKETGSSNNTVGVIPDCRRGMSASTQMLPVAGVMMTTLAYRPNAEEPERVSTSARECDPEEIKARERNISSRCPFPCRGGSQTDFSPCAAKPTIRPCRSSRSANDAAKITPCSIVELAPCPTWTRRSASSNIQQLLAGAPSKSRTKSESWRADVGQWIQRRLSLGRYSRTLAALTVRLGASGCGHFPSVLPPGVTSTLGKGTTGGKTSMGKEAG